MPGFDALLILAALVAVAAVLALARRVRTIARTEDVIVDLEFLRARPAELEQRISELAALSGRRTLGARMWTAQLAQEPPPASPATRTRRRSRPLVASR